MRRVIVNALLVVCSLGLFLALLEGLAAVFPVKSLGDKLVDAHNFKADRAAEPDVRLGYRLRKSISVAGFRHNSLGFIGDEFSRTKPPGVCRVICMGGSTTLGAGADSDRYSYPQLLQAIFDRTGQATGRRVEVVNAGVFGYHSLHTALRMQSELAELSPDAYVVMDGLNDLVAAKSLSVKDIVALGSGQEALTRLAPGQSLAARLDRALSHLRSYRLLRQLAASRSLNQADEPKPLDLAARLEAFGFRRNLDLAADSAQAQHADLVLVAYPWKVNPAAGPDSIAALGLHPEHLALYTFGRQAVTDIVRDVALRKHAVLVEPQPLFDAHPYTRKSLAFYWADDIHFSRLGNFLIAKSVYKALMELPKVRQALGTDQAASPEAIDTLFPEVMLWNPPDGSGWPAKKDALPCTVVRLENLKESKPDDQGVAFLSPADAARPGLAVLDVDLQAAGGQVRLYPRVQGQADTVKLSLDGYPTAPALFSFGKPVDDGLWTPVSAWYAFALPDAAKGTVRLQVLLTGENAQLWRCGGEALFKMP